MPFDSSCSALIEFNAASAGRPTVEDVQRRFNLDAREMDLEFGVLPIQPDKKTFVVSVSKEAGERVKKQKPDGFIALWGNPKIEPFKG